MCTMKMSLCNTFRFVVSLIFVLSIIDTPVAFTLHRTTSDVESTQDLAQEESTKFEIKVTNNIQANTKENNANLKLNVVGSNSSISNGSKNIEKNKNNKIIDYDYIRNMTSTLDGQILGSDPIKAVRIINFEQATEPFTTSADGKSYNDKYIQSVPSDKSISKILNSNQTINVTNNDKEYEATESETTTDLPTSTKFDESEMTTSFELAKPPSLKKYTTIDRKRQRLKISDENKIQMNSTEEMINLETKQSRISLQDTDTSDIPSLEQLKNDLLYSNLKEQPLQNKKVHKSTLKETATPTTITSTSVVLSTETEPSSNKWQSIESIRAGYLDLSKKNTSAGSITGKEPSEFEVISKEALRTMFEIDNTEIDNVDEKSESRTESQSQLNEDTIQEELLKEKLLNDKEEIAKRIDTTIQTLDILTNFSIHDKLIVKPLSGEKGKNTSLYAVSPNYKPLPKIEVQAPKQFVRDPDDNSWRNESLSSLGIVFKPKNSSKPFTQVLKNKTETEWNTLLEKDNKIDLPDLKERLQKMAERRKSKKKKTDSLGNIVYFDYEDSSSSSEKLPKDEPISTVLYPPEPTTSTQKLNSTSVEINSDITTAVISTTEKIRGKVRDSYSTKKFKKLFNVPEYYDSTDEDETDYLNMAKIDIKKFTTTPKTSSLPVTQRMWGITNILPTIPPERKGTIQYFPPLTTQKVNINDYDNDFKSKVNSFTINTESPKYMLPVSSAKTTPENTSQYKIQNNEKLKNIVITDKPVIEKIFYPTDPPRATHPDFTLLNDDGTFDRDSYVVRHYKDFMSIAAKDHEFDKNMDYGPYTPPTTTVTKADLIKYVTEKSKANMDQEYDYETQFRKDVLQRFVDNFNQNSERYKSQFPILFNNSIIHSDSQNGREIASSRAFMRGLYDSDFKTKLPYKEMYNPNHENITVELSPAYELHYYMPEQEEREEAVQQPVTLPYQYRL